MKRFLVLIHLAGKTADSPAQRMAKLHSTLTSMLDDAECAFTSDKGFAMACTSPKTDEALWKSLVEACKLVTQDNITVMELGLSITSSHRGVRQWASKTMMLAGLEELQQQK